MQDEGSQLVARALTLAAGRRRHRPLAGPVRGPGRQDRAAGRARRRGRSPGHRGRARTAPRRPRGAEHPRAAASRCCASTAATPAWSRGFDRVLVDAPCTGLGALRRRPEARWRRQPGRRAGAGRSCSANCWRAAIALTRPGGVVLYATCSPHLAETVGVVADALRRRAGARAGHPAAVRPVDRPRRRAVRAAVAAPARHRRDVRRGARFDSLTSAERHVATPMAADRAVDPGRRLRPAGRRGRRGARRRLVARRCDGQPLRAQPDDRPAGGGEPARSHRHPDGLPSDDRGPRPLGAAVRRGGRLQRHLPRRGHRQPGRRRPATSGPPAPRRG